MVSFTPRARRSPAGDERGLFPGLRGQGGLVLSYHSPPYAKAFEKTLEVVIMS